MDIRLTEKGIKYVEDKPEDYDALNKNKEFQVMSWIYGNFDLGAKISIDTIVDGMYVGKPIKKHKGYPGELGYSGWNFSQEEFNNTIKKLQKMEYIETS